LDLSFNNISGTIPCWFDLHHTWPNGQVWALISRPDRGCPARVWLVGPIAQCL
jgi:hypothetical protein